MRMWNEKVREFTVLLRESTRKKVVRNWTNMVAYQHLLKGLFSGKRVELKRYITIPLRWIMWTLRAGVSRLLLMLLSCLLSTHWGLPGSMRGS